MVERDSTGERYIVEERVRERKKDRRRKRERKKERGGVCVCV